jgi:hypothetical protein
MLAASFIYIYFIKPLMTVHSIDIINNSSTNVADPNIEIVCFNSVVKEQRFIARA